MASPRDLVSGIMGNGELFFGIGLTDELAQQAGAQFELKALLFFSARCADRAFRIIVAGDAMLGKV